MDRTMEPQLSEKLRAAGIDLEFCQRILDTGIPAPPPMADDGWRLAGAQNPAIIDSRLAMTVQASPDQIAEIFAGMGIPSKLSSRLLYTLGARLPPGDGRNIAFDRPGLEFLGTLLMPFCSFGLLNGGAATSYFDEGKNRQFAPLLMERTRDLLEDLRNRYSGLPKALCPAWYLSQGRPGLSFLEHKIRTVLGQLASAFELWRRAGILESTIGEYAQSPHFCQMVNTPNRLPLAQALQSLAEMAKIRNCFGIRQGYQLGMLEGVQLLGTALDLEDPVKPAIFTRKNGEVLALPAGHGQFFTTMSGVFGQLTSQGKTMLCVGNIDNLAYSMNPLAIALQVLHSRKASYEFSYRTALDTKGGVLLENSQAELACFDVGQSLETGRFADFCRLDQAMLFNCATGLFDLDWLRLHHGELAGRLPYRISEQHKEPGHYWQLEQNLWDSIPLVPRMMILGVEKSQRFLPAKLLADTLLLSGSAMDEPQPQDRDELQRWNEAKKLWPRLEDLKQAALLS